jgi:hypothetical protein
MLGSAGMQVAKPGAALPSEAALEFAKASIPVSKSVAWPN